MIKKAWGKYEQLVLFFSCESGGNIRNIIANLLAIFPILIILYFIFYINQTTIMQ